MSWQPTLKALWSPIGQQVMMPTPGQTNKQRYRRRQLSHWETLVIIRKRKQRIQIAELFSGLLTKHPTQTGIRQTANRPQ